MLLIIIASFWSSYCEIRAEPHCGQKYGQFPKHCHRPFIHRIPLVYLCVSCKQHSRGLLNQIKMASLKNIITSLRIIVHCYSYHVYHQNDTLKHLLRNCHLKLLRPRRLQISKILSHASESSLVSSYLVLSIIVTFWSFYGEILAEPYYCPKDNQFPKHCQTPHNNLS